MPRKIGHVDRVALTSAALPPATNSYTVISHQYVIDTILTALQNNGFEIEAEEYKCITDAKVAHGTFIINYQGDSDLSLMYTFSNSYDKSLRFRAAIGAHITANNAYMVSNMDSWLRKHTGTADQEAYDLINGHIENAVDYFDQLKQAKDQMKEYTISKQEFGSIIGELFMNDYLAVDQISVIRKEFNKPSYSYEYGVTNLWTCYQIIADAMKLAHPSKWMSSQVALHLYFTTKYNLTVFDEEEAVENEDPSDTIANSEAQFEDNAITLPGFPTVSSDEEVEELAEAYLNEVTDGEYSDTQEDEVINETVDLDQEEDDEWDKLEEAGVIKQVGFDNTTIDNHDDLSPEQLADMHAEQFDNAVEGSPDAPWEEQPEPKEEDKEYFFASDYPGLQTGDCFEVTDGEYYVVTDIQSSDDGELLVCEPVSEEEETVDDTPEITGIPNGDAMSDTDEEEWHNEQEFSIEDTPVAVEENSEESDVQRQEEVEDISFTQDPVKDNIIDFVEDIYGYRPDVTYTAVGNDYNVVLETGETIVIPQGEIG